MLERERMVGWLIDFKELAHTVVGTDKPEICRAGCQAGDPRESWCCSSSLNPQAEHLFPKAFSWLDEAHPHYRG